MEASTQPSTNALSLPSRQPRILIDRWRALAIVTLAYGSVACAGPLLFRYVEAVRGSPDGRGEQVAEILAAIMGVLWLVSVVRILFRR